MRRQLLASAVLVVLILSMGCTGSARQKPGPKNPSPPLLDAGTAVSYAKQYTYGIYEGASIVVAFTVTHRVLGTPCAWNGSEAGNATNWMMFLEGIIYQLDSYLHIEIAVEVHYSKGEIFASHAKVSLRQLDYASINTTKKSIEDLSVEPYLSTGSHDLFLKADAARWSMTEKYYLQSINMTLNHNTTSRIPGTATWEVAYRYIARSDYSASASVVVLDASDGRVLKVEPPR